MSHHGPEYFLKQDINEHLKTLHRDGAIMELPPPYVFMPVQMGYGKRTIDFLIAARKLVTINGVTRRSDAAVFLGIETKAPNEKPTKKQEACMHEICEAGGVAFWCDSFSGYLMNMYVNGFIAMPRGPEKQEARFPIGRNAMIL